MTNTRRVLWALKAHDKGILTGYEAYCELLECGVGEVTAIRLIILGWA